MEADFGPWDPLRPRELAAVFADYPGVWCIAGGWALELAAGRSWRAQDDIDVVVFREDAPYMHHALPEWDLHLAGSGQMSLWHVGDALPPEVHDIWIRREVGPWRFQLMVTDREGDAWVFRGDRRIRGPLDTLMIAAAGLPVLAPEIQLLYKSKRPNRPKDDQDFEEVLPHLTPTQQERLASWLDLLYGDHPWLARLR